MLAPPVAAWRLQFVALAAIWGASFLFIKVAVEDLSPIAVALVRCALGATTLLVVLALRRDRLPRDRRVWGHLAVVGLLGNAIPFTLFGIAEQHISSVLAGLWNATTPLLTLLVVLVALPEEHPTRERVLGLLAGFVGVTVVLGPWAAPGGDALTGQLLCLAASAGYALAFPYLRRHLSGRPESTVALAAGQLVCATAFLALAAPLGFRVADGGVGLDALGAVAALGALGTGLAYVLNTAIIRAAGATVATTVTYLIPLFSTILGIVVLGESLTWNQPVGAAIVLTGVALGQRRRG